VRIVLLTALALTAPAHAGKRKAKAPSLIQTAELIVGRALQSREQSWQKMMELCDGIGHRLSGTPQLEKAVAWAAEHMQRDGLDVTREPVEVRRWVRGQESLVIDGGVPREVPMLGLGNSVGTDGKVVEGQVLVVDSFDDLTAKKDQVKGRIVLYDVPFSTYGETVQYRVRGASAAARHGAVAALVRSVGPHSLATPHTGTLGYADDAPQIPAAAVDIETATQLRRLQEAGRPATARLSMQAHFDGTATSHNVVGEIRGRENPDEIVVVGCHLDSWDVGQGAQDDAAGCVAAMEAGRILASLDVAPRRTVRVVLFTNEENGLAGGRTYQEEHAREDIVAAMEMDTGAGAFLGYRIDTRTGGTREEDDAERARVIAAFEPVRPAFAALDPEFIPSYGGADIGPLVGHGTLGVGLHMDTTGYWPIHHTEADTLDKIDRDHFQRDVAGMALMTWVLAEWPELPRVQRSDGGHP